MDRSKVKKLLIGKFSIRRLIRSTILIYAIIAIFLYFYADRIIFLPQPASYGNWPNILKIKTETDIQISALYLPEPKAKFTIIYSHGNSEDIGDIRLVLERFNSNGFSVFAYDYQGYGTSQGRPSETKAYQEIEAVYQYVTNELKIPPNRIIAMGRSIGSGATHLASRRQVAGLILESPLTSAFRVVTRISLMPFDKFNNLRNIKNIDCPVLIIHGTKDEIVPIWHGRKLFEKADEPKFSLWVENAGHNDDICQIAGTSYWEKIRQLTNTIEEKTGKKDLP